MKKRNKNDFKTMSYRKQDLMIILIITINLTTNSQMMHIVL